MLKNTITNSINDALLSVASFVVFFSINIIVIIISTR
jgi:hypothetical protein